MNKTVFYTESELILLLNTGNEDAFSYLYDNYCSALYGIILEIIADRETADDILQEVFLTIWKKIKSYDASKGRLFTWMVSITRHLTIDVVRSKTYRNNKKNDDIADELFFCNHNNAVHLNLDCIGLKKAVQKLKPQYRSIIELSYFYGYTQEEIAKIEAIPLGTVKTRLRTALTVLRVYFITHDAVFSRLVTRDNDAIAV